jgi:hypothetical protein
MMERAQNRWQWAVLGAFALVLSASVTAAPFVPAGDGQVLERLPDRTTPQYRELKRLQAEVAATPNDVAAAAALANAYYRISRSEGDPRFLGYAQAALTPWWKDAEAPSRSAGHARDAPAE